MPILLPGAQLTKSKRRPIQLTSLNSYSKFRLHPVTPSSSKILAANSPFSAGHANCS